MNRTTIVIISSLLLAGLFLALAPQTDATTVNIPDANLRKAINRGLRKPLRQSNRSDNATVTRDEIRRLTSVDGDNFRDLTGLEHATNLTSLTAWRSDSLTDITPLTGLTTLRRLELLAKGLTNITPLSGLTNLTRLTLLGSITDITPLARLTKLRFLDLNFNSITDITPLCGMTQMEYLYLSRNNITDITPLCGMTKLRILYLMNNNITDVTPLSGLTKLGWLSLPNNNITDVTPLARLTNLTHLGLGGNSITDVTPLSGLTTLRTLYLNNNQIADLYPLTTLGKQLRTLLLQNNQISEIAALNALQKLNRLDLRDNPLNTHATKTIKTLQNTGIRWGLKYTPTENNVPIPDARLRAAINTQLGSERAATAVVTKTEMESLTTLTAHGTATEKINDIRGLSYAKNLTELYLESNDITDVTPISSLIKLEHLHFDNNKNLADITLLANLKKLKFLDIWRTKVSDISTIRYFKKLERLQARGTGMSDISAAEYIPKYYIFEMSWNNIRDLTPLVNNPGVNGKWDVVHVVGNPLSYPAIYTQIPALKARSVRVLYTNRTPGTPTKSSGDTQTGTVSTTLAKPLVVQVNDTATRSKAFEGVPITWSVTGGGTLSSTQTTTNINGKAAVQLTLGSTPGTNTVTASQTHNGVTNTLVFTTTANPLVQQQRAEGDDNDNNKPPKEDLIGVARDRYVLLESHAGDKKADLSYWHTLKLIYKYKIEGIVEDLSAEKRALRQAVASNNRYNLLETLLNAFDTEKGDALLKKYNETLDRLNSEHEAYTKAIDAADTAYDKYAELTGGEPELELERTQIRHRITQSATKQTNNTATQ